MPDFFGSKQRPLGLLLVALCTSTAYADPPSAARHAPAQPPPAVPVASPPAPPVGAFDAQSPSIEPVSFEEAIRRTLSRNPTLVIAETEVRRARALAEQIRAGSLPLLSLNGTYTRLDADRVLNGRVIAGADSFNGNLLLTIPLVAPQRWVQWSHARENVDVASASQADVRRAVAGNVGHAYITLSSQHRIIATLERARENAVAHMQFAHARFAGGVGNRLDEVRAAQEIAADELQIANQRGVLARQQAILGLLMGLDHPVDAVDDATVREPPTEQQALETATRQRTDLQLGQRRLRAAEHVRDDSWTDFLPTLFGTFQPFYQNPPTLTLPTWGWQAQLVLSVPLYDGGLRYGARHEREALATEARTNVDALVAQTRIEVRTAFEALRQAEAAAAASHASARLADEALSLAEEAYRAGATTNIEVIDAQRRARDASATANAADDAVRQARLDLLLAAGVFP